MRRVDGCFAGIGSDEIEEIKKAIGGVVRCESKMCRVHIAELELVVGIEFKLLQCGMR